MRYKHKVAYSGPFTRTRLAKTILTDPFQQFIITLLVYRLRSIWLDVIQQSGPQ